MRVKLIILLATFVAVMLAGVFWISREPKPRGPEVVSLAQPASRAPETIESSGQILGVAIGLPMAEAREKLDPLRAAGRAYEPDQKEQKGRRIYWKLKETEYDWIMVWANAEGNVTRVRAVLRPDKTMPFNEIGNLGRAASADPSRAKWNLRRPDGANFRLIVQGAGQRASSVYMFSLEPDPAEQPRNAERDPAENP